MLGGLLDRILVGFSEKIESIFDASLKQSRKSLLPSREKKSSFGLFVVIGVAATDGGAAAAGGAVLALGFIPAVALNSSLTIAAIRLVSLDVEVDRCRFGVDCCLCRGTNEISLGC